MIRALLIFVVGCSYVDTVTSADGTVYQCGSAEYCFDGDADELSDLTGATCTGADRWWPRITNAVGRGCVYCCGDDCPRGANAKDGSWCQ